MRKTDVAIVGGSAAGLTAAITARRHYPDKKITLVRKEKLVPIPCGIPYIFGTVGSAQKNLIPDTPLEKNKVDFLIDEVVELDREKRSLKTQSGEEVAYDKLVIATGSLPMMPPIPGFEKENVYPVFKDVERLGAMQEKMKASKKVVVIGGGFIGVEMSDEMNKMGNLDVTICELLPHCLQLAFDQEFCTEAEKLLKDHVVEMEALTYIRGRSISGQYVIVDEAQNLTPHEVKTIISRAGEGTKMVLTGDPYQIDNPYLDSSSNGLTYTVERLKDLSIHGHITLRKSERSELAGVAADYL